MLKIIGGKMRIIVNASNLRAGGSIQVTESIIFEASKFVSDSHEFHFFLSPAFMHLKNKLVNTEQCIYYWVGYPSRFSITGTCKQLDGLESIIKPDVTFSVFGPNYWKPKSKHVVGFAQGYYLYQDLPFFKSMKFTQKAKWYALSKYHRHILKYHADKYIVETEDVKNKFAKFLSVKSSDISVVSNTHGDHFNDFKRTVNFEMDNCKFKLLTIAYPYPHKNLLILKAVADICMDKGLDILFYITVSDSYYIENFYGYESKIKNLGKVNNLDVPSLYEQCDAMILPTLVECFSASYPEAMKMRKPILTSNYSFAKSICGDAALYFDPYSPVDIADKIIQICSSKEIMETLRLNGDKRLMSFKSSTERFSSYIEICESL